MPKKPPPVLVGTDVESDSRTGLLNQVEADGSCGSRPVKKHFTALVAACLIVFSPGVSGVDILPTSDKTVTVDGSFRLKCDGGDRWFHVERGEREEIRHGGRYEISAPSTLTVFNAAFDDAGIYLCCLMDGKDETCFEHRVVVLPKPPCEPFEAPVGMWTDAKSTHFQLGCIYNSNVWNYTCIRGVWTGVHGPCPLERPACKNETLTGECRPSPHEATNYWTEFIVVTILLVLAVILLVGAIVVIIVQHLKLSKLHHLTNADESPCSDLPMEEIGNRPENAEEQEDLQQIPRMQLDDSLRFDLPKMLRIRPLNYFLNLRI